MFRATEYRSVIGKIVKDQCIMPTARINDVEIYYESYGKGFPLVFAYGPGGNTGMWSGQIDAFSKHYRFIVWDPRGHGKSDSPPRSIPGSQLVILPQAGHLSNLDCPEAFNEAILKFLDQVAT